MESVLEISVFAGKVFFLVLGIAAVVMVIASFAIKPRPKEHLEVENLNEKFDAFKYSLKTQFLGKKALKHESKERKKTEQRKRKQGHTGAKAFVLNFEGDLKASAVENLRDEITAVLSVAEPQDEVVVKVTSGGGLVHTYGLAAAQLLRIKDHNLQLTVCVDKIAASGGYLMACTADQILAAPFAIVGSIGVLAQVPNLSRLLKKNNIDYEEFTSGEYKRTVSIFGEITEKGRQKFSQQLEETHELFKQFVKTHRSQVDLAKIATGEHWLAAQAKELQLVDQIMTSDEYIMKLTESKSVFKISIQYKQKLSEKISDVLGRSAQAVIDSVVSRLSRQET